MTVCFADERALSWHADRVTERVEPMPGVDITWEPNAPDAVLISDP